MIVLPSERPSSLMVGGRWPCFGAEVVIAVNWTDFVTRFRVEFVYAIEMQQLESEF